MGKNLLMLFVRVACVAITLSICVFNSAYAEERVFTGANGQTFRGQLLKKEGEQVTVKRVDGRVFTLNANQFSEADQNYIKAFVNKPKPLPKLTLKDFKEYPYTTSFRNRKLDPSLKNVFDELKVTKGKRIRIHGKKKNDSGRVEGRAVNHMGKMVLFPPGKRSGELTAKLPSQEDVRFYHLAISLKDTDTQKNKLISRPISLEKGVKYRWLYSEENGVGSLKIEQTTKEGVTVIATISAKKEEIEGIGFAATVRWIGNEADLSITVK